MGLINREMASRREGPLLGEPFGLEVFWQNLLENLGDPFWGNLSDWKCFGEPFGPPKT
jgi:hypothetical protein